MPMRSLYVALQGTIKKGPLEKNMEPLDATLIKRGLDSWTVNEQIPLWKSFLKAFLRDPTGVCRKNHHIASFFWRGNRIDLPIKKGIIWYFFCRHQYFGDLNTKTLECRNLYVDFFWMEVYCAESCQQSWMNSQRLTFSMLSAGPAFAPVPALFLPKRPNSLGNFWFVKLPNDWQPNWSQFKL